MNLQPGRLPLDSAALADGLLATAGRFAGLISQVDDQQRQVRTAPGWTCAELIHHVAHLPDWWVEMTRSDARVASSASDMAVLNRDRLTDLADADTSQCAQRLQDGITRFAAVVRSAPQGTVPFHANSRATIDQIAGVALGELEMHGHDLARTTRQPWRVNADHAACAILSSVGAAGGGWVDPAAASGHNGRYEIRLRGGRGSLRLAFSDGVLTVNPHDPAWRPDARISADPAEFAKVLYGRKGQWIPALTGRIVATGRRPWRALKLQPMFLPI